MADENYDEFEDLDLLEGEEEHEQYKAPTKADRFVGPVTSVVLHLVVILLLYITVRQVLIYNENTVKARTVVPKTVEIEEVKELTEEIKELNDNTFADNPNMNFSETVDNTDNSEDVENETEVDLEALSNMQDVKSPVRMAGLFANRSAGGRNSALRMFGGGSGTESAVLKALNWLKENQTPDGSWDTSAKTAMASFAILTFLAHGETPTSKKYGKTVQRAIEFVRDKQKPDGRFNNGDGHEYTHPIATYALAEAYAMTKIPTLREPMERAANVLIDGAIYKQFPADGTMRPVTGVDQSAGGNVTGAFFDYNLKNGAYPNGSKNSYQNADGTPMRPIMSNGVRADHSYMGFCNQALKALKFAGTSNPKIYEVIEASANGIKFFQGNTGGFGYSSQDTTAHKSGNSRNQAGVGAYTVQLIDNSTSSEAAKSRDYLYELGFPSVPSKRWFYDVYYKANANFWFQGGNWDKWNPEMKAWLIKNQRKDGAWTNEAIGESDTYGLVYPTCLGALSLMVYYRNLPGSQGSAKMAAKPKSRKVQMTDMKVEVKADGELDLDAVNLDDIKF